MDTAPLRIGYCLSLSGGLASNGKTARLAHQIWQEHVNTNGGLLGRPVELVCLDDQTNPKLVADLYQRLLDAEQVDVVVGGYGDNSVAPAMPLIMERQRFFLGLMALAVNATFNYPHYFVMIPTGPHPALALTEGFFQVAGQQNPTTRDGGHPDRGSTVCKARLREPGSISQDTVCGSSSTASIRCQRRISRRTWRI